jgi:hypothetical protein
MYAMQEAAIFNPSRYSLIEASTKSGKTVGCIVWLFEQAAEGKDGQNYWWIAPTYPVSAIAFSRMKRYIPMDFYNANETDPSITLINGAKIWFKSGDKPDTLYGEDVYAAVIDEASRVKEDSWWAVRSTLTSTRGPVRIIGNVKGRKNWFWQMARKAQSGEPGMEYHRMTASDAVAGGVLDQAEIDDAKNILPEMVYKELYEAEAADDGGNPFGLRHITAQVRPLSSGKPLAWGWDLAKKRDYTVGIALDENNAVCRYHRFQKPWNETVEFIRRETKGLKALVDSTGVGDAILEQLQRTTGGLRRPTKGVGGELSLPGHNFEGFVFSGPSKQQLMEELSTKIQHAEVWFPDNEIKSELETFEYEYTRTGVRYAAPEGMYDDCVCALALAVRKFGRRIAEADIF